MEPVDRTPVLQRTRWLALLVGLLWLIHGLEKLLFVLAPAYRLPAPLYGGVGNVGNILTLFANQNPFGWFRSLVSQFMLPLGAFNQYGVTLFELTLGALFLAGPSLWVRRPRLLYGAVVAGTAMLCFIWLGFAGSEWFFTYLLIIYAQVTIGLNLWSALHAERGATDWGFLLRGLLGLLWLIEGYTGGSWLYLLTGAALLLGILTPAFALVGALLTCVAMRGGWWGGWWWLYYVGLANHLYVALTRSGRRYGLDRLLARRIRWPRQLERVRRW